MRRGPGRRGFRPGFDHLIVLSSVLTSFSGRLKCMATEHCESPGLNWLTRLSENLAVAHREAENQSMRPPVCSAHSLVIAVVLCGCATEPVRRTFVDTACEPPVVHSVPATRSQVRSTSYRAQWDDSVRSVVASKPLPPPDEDHEPSFCKLNPEGCPPLPPPQAAIPSVFECLQACHGTIEQGEAFCNNLPDSNPRAQKSVLFGTLYRGHGL